MNPLDYLFGLELHGIKLGLENITRLLDATGNPQNAYPTVHVGGTNGKGSTVAFLDHILRESGYRVGRFTSPHLISVNERFMINGESIGDSQLETLIETYCSQAKQCDISPTFFEINTAIAFQYFADEDVDIALIEVGLGGRFDSTNVITPRVSVVTNIDLEHTQYLGDTLGKIAFEKAGIIKPEIPVVFGNLKPEAEEVLVKTANERKAPHLQLGTDFTGVLDDSTTLFDFKGQDWVAEDVLLPFLGQHQSENAAVAMMVAEILSEEFEAITAKTAQAGIANSRWPCRLETVLENPTVLIDVAHNPAGARILVDTLSRDVVLILSVATDKRAEEMVSVLSGCAKHIIFTQFEGPRAADPEELADHLPRPLPYTVEPDLGAAIHAGIRMAQYSQCPLLITGSLFVAGQAREHLIKEYRAPRLQF
jgi:dihydrofolate synthase/folylpolyglutamate synthase